MKTVVVLACLRGCPYKDGIKYLSDNEQQVYFLSSWPLVCQYFPQLIESLEPESSAKQNTLSIILIYEDFSVLLDALQMLYKIGTRRRREFQDSYLTHVKQTVALSTHVDPDTLQLSLPVGHCDVPIGFDVRILLDANNIDHVSPQSVAVQQILRFFALKHGSYFGAVSNLEQCVLLLPSILSLLDYMALPQLESSLYIYNATGVDIFSGFLLHQILPLGWDSWNRISLLGTSIPSSHSLRLLESDDHFFELDQIYNKFMNGKSQDKTEIMSQISTIIG